jgi:DNA replication protein DnaC
MHPAEELYRRMMRQAEQWVSADKAACIQRDRRSRDVNPDDPIDDWDESIWLRERDNRLYAARRKIEKWIDRQSAPLFWSADIQTLGDGPAGDKVREYANGRARNLMLAGPVGTGKSHAAWAVAHHYVARELDVMFRSVPRLLLDMRPDGDETAFPRACTADVLILDDIGAARATEWASEQMYCIVEERCSYQRRTIVTTNSTYEQLAAIWGGPIMDRLRDKAIAVEMTGKSRRGAA